MQNDEQPKWQRGDLVQLKCGGPCMVVETPEVYAAGLRIETVVRYADLNNEMRRTSIPPDLLVPWAIDSETEDIEQWKAQCEVECAAEHEARIDVRIARNLLTAAQSVIDRSMSPGIASNIDQFLKDTEQYRKDADG